MKKYLAVLDVKTLEHFRSVGEYALVMWSLWLMLSTGGEISTAFQIPQFCELSQLGVSDSTFHSMCVLQNVILTSVMTSVRERISSACIRLQ